MGNRSQQVAVELRRVREKAGLTQEQMAAHLGLVYAPGGRKVSTGRATVSSWESARRPLPPEHRQAYIDLGGDPAILVPPPLLPSHGESAEKPPTQPGPEPEPAAAAAEGPTSAPGLRGRFGSRWPWLIVVLVVVSGGVAAVCFAVLPGNGPGPSGPASTWTETTGTPAHTWADPVQLTGAGTPLGPRQSVQVQCRVRGYVVQDGDLWWYRLSSSPWNGHYYATSDAFYNNGATSGSVKNGVFVDEQVPVCPGN